MCTQSKPFITVFIQRFRKQKSFYGLLLALITCLQCSEQSRGEEDPVLRLGPEEALQTDWLKTRKYSKSKGDFGPHYHNNIKNSGTVYVTSKTHLNDTLIVTYEEEGIRETYNTDWSAILTPYQTVYRDTITTNNSRIHFSWVPKNHSFDSYVGKWVYFRGETLAYWDAVSTTYPGKASFKFLQKIGLIQYNYEWRMGKGAGSEEIDLMEYDDIPFSEYELIPLN